MRMGQAYPVQRRPLNGMLLQVTHSNPHVHDGGCWTYALQFMHVGSCATCAWTTANNQRQVHAHDCDSVRRSGQTP